MNNKEILQKIMDDKFLSARTFGKKIGVASNYVSEISTGKITQITPAVIAKIVAAFPEYSPDWLRTGEPPIYSNVEAHRVSRSVISNGNGNTNTVTNADAPDRLLTLMEGQTAALLRQLEKKDEQIARLLTLLEGRRDG